jgi:hypothetical protein
MRLSAVLRFRANRMAQNHAHSDQAFSDYLRMLSSSDYSLEAV